jgi:oligopeptide/dipeptide ABC transporter ATP-binding protein
VTWLAAMQLLGPRARTGGTIWYDGRNLLEMDEKQLTRMRGSDMTMIFQDPISALNPVHSVGRQIVESIRFNPLPPQSTPTGFVNNSRDDSARSSADRRQAHRNAAEHLLRRVGIPEARHRMNEFPHQLSGGMNQRAMIAMSLAGKPQLLIADEPTTALDVTIQAQILELIRGLRDEFGMSVVLITHDLGVVAETCDRVAVMYCGRIVEQGAVKHIFFNPRHPYTQGLLASIPRIDQRADKLVPIEGSVPSPQKLPPGCAFAPRCHYALAACSAAPPETVVEKHGHTHACLNPQSEEKLHEKG